MNTKISIGALVATTLVFGVLAFKAPSVVTVPDKSLGNASPVVNVPAPVVNVQVPEQKAPIVNVSTPKQVGAISSPDLPWKWMSVGGIRIETGRTDALTQGSTTICALQAPNATSVLVSGSLRLTVSSTTATIVTLAKASTAYATTTLLGVANIAANGTDTILASTTPTAGEATIFAANEWFVVGMQGGVYASSPYTPTGVCQATWEVI